ncbi:hypothetical protein FQA39_LY08497 [Lamprigera yunnana]|nr:hypothetical protein FQA39_LY08497 [Lamprigera yunnana]
MEHIWFEDDGMDQNLIMHFAEELAQPLPLEIYFPTKVAKLKKTAVPSQNLPQKSIITPEYRSNRKNKSCNRKRTGNEIVENQEGEEAHSTQQCENLISEAHSTCLDSLIDKEKVALSGLLELHAIDIKLFKRRRVEQLEAVKSFKRITSYEKQYSMIFLMAEKIFSTIQESRAQIEASGYIPGISQFPTEMEVKEALSNILENTALFSEILLRFPEITTAVLKFNNNWDILLQWCIVFCNEVKYLLDKSTITLINLVSQELNHTKRDPNYVNPYRKKIHVEDGTADDLQREKKRKRKDIKKGPRFTRIEL